MSLAQELIKNKVYLGKKFDTALEALTEEVKQYNVDEIEFGKPFDWCLITLVDGSKIKCTVTKESLASSTITYKVL